MPRGKGKRRKLSGIAKQKNIINARLVEINKKTDRYIYKNEPITEREAEVYILEMESYKALVRGDERSMQVIEKLTKIMKTIIAELHGLIHYNINNEDIETNGHVGDEITPSPVYSLNEEDQILTEHYYQKMVDNETFTNGIQTMHNFNAFKTLQKVTNDHVNDIEKCGLNLENYINNLSLKDDEDNGCKITLENSPSILQNMTDNTSFLQNVDMATPHKSSVCSNISQSNHILPKVMDKIIENTKEYVTQELKPTSARVTRKAVETCDTKNNISQTNKETVDSIKHISLVNNDSNLNSVNSHLLIPVKRIDIQQNNMTSNDFEKPNAIQYTNTDSANANPKVYITQMKAKETKPCKRRITKKKKFDSEADSITKVEKPKRVKKRKNQTIMKDLSKDTNKRNSTCDVNKSLLIRPEANTNNSPNLSTDYQVLTPLIVEKSAANILKAIPAANTHSKDGHDLSWLENMRYFRQIDMDEYTTAIYDDSFWDSLAFPNDWNEDDFNI